MPTSVQSSGRPGSGSRIPLPFVVPRVSVDCTLYQAWLFNLCAMWVFNAQGSGISHSVPANVQEMLASKPVYLDETLSSAIKTGMWCSAAGNAQPSHIGHADCIWFCVVYANLCSVQRRSSGCAGGRDSQKPESLCLCGSRDFIHHEPAWRALC